MKRGKREHSIMDDCWSDELLEIETDVAEALAEAGVCRRQWAADDHA